MLVRRLKACSGLLMPSIALALLRARGKRMRDKVVWGSALRFGRPGLHFV
jgi:hypothetical protein